MTVVKLYKLILITYIFICLKNLLQIFYATIFITNGYLNFYSLGEENAYSIKTIFFNICFYDFFLLFPLYISVFLLLYYIIKIFGNKIGIQVFYILLIYSSIMFAKEHGNFHIEYIIIPVILGYVDWLMFKKWIKFE